MEKSLSCLDNMIIKKFFGKPKFIDLIKEGSYLFYA